MSHPDAGWGQDGRDKARGAPRLGPGDSGYHRMAWADALLEACTEADLTIKVPADFPVFAARLYETLGVATEIDPALPPWKRGGLSEHPRRPK